MAVDPSGLVPKGEHDVEVKAAKDGDRDALTSYLTALEGPPKTTADEAASVGLDAAAEVQGEGKAPSFGCFLVATMISACLSPAGQSNIVITFENPKGITYKAHWLAKGIKLASPKVGNNGGVHSAVLTPDLFVRDKATGKEGVPLKQHLRNCGLTMNNIVFRGSLREAAAEGWAYRLRQYP